MRIFNALALWHIPPKFRIKKPENPLSIEGIAKIPGSG
jgi:hypothetical protein